jgi:hypothetical protein
LAPELDSAPLERPLVLADADAEDAEAPDALALTPALLPWLWLALALGPALALAEGSALALTLALAEAEGSALALALAEGSALALTLALAEGSTDCEAEGDAEGSTAEEEMTSEGAAEDSTAEEAVESVVVLGWKRELQRDQRLPQYPQLAQQDSHIIGDFFQSWDGDNKQVVASRVCFRFDPEWSECVLTVESCYYYSSPARVMWCRSVLVWTD